MFFSCVPGHLGKADQLPVLIEEPIDGDAGPETGAVLADTPTFAFVFASFGGDLEGSRWNAFFAFFGRVEAREVLADDLFLGISFDPLPAQIPIRHMPLWINH